MAKRKKKNKDREKTGEWSEKAIEREIKEVVLDGVQALFMETLMPTMPPWEIQQHRQNIQILVKDMGCEFREEWSEDPTMDSKECRFTILKNGKVLKEVIHGAGNISFMKKSAGMFPSDWN